MTALIRLRSWQKSPVHQLSITLHNTQGSSLVRSQNWLDMEPRVSIVLSYFTNTKWVHTQATGDESQTHGESQGKNLKLLFVTKVDCYIYSLCVKVFSPTWVHLSLFELHLKIFDISWRFFGVRIFDHELLLHFFHHLFLILPPLETFFRCHNTPSLFLTIFWSAVGKEQADCKFFKSPAHGIFLDSIAKMFTGNLNSSWTNMVCVLLLS